MSPAHSVLSHGICAAGCGWDERTQTDVLQLCVAGVGEFTFRCQDAHAFLDDLEGMRPVVQQPAVYYWRVYTQFEVLIFTLHLVTLPKYSKILIFLT